MQPIFITGIGTNVGKTVASAIVTEALNACYWKPIQAGIEPSTDSDIVRNLISNSSNRILKESYVLKLAASPHLAAREEGVSIQIDTIINDFHHLVTQHPNTKYIVIEGAGGILAPISSDLFILDLIIALKAKVILISRNYLGSINHSLLSSFICKEKKLDTIGWIFNDNYLNYEEEIVAWSNIPCIFSLPFKDKVDKFFIEEQSNLLRKRLQLLL